MPKEDFIGKYVLVTTGVDKKGVFVGRLIQDNSPDYVILVECRMIIYWPTETRGVLGLSNVGAIEGCPGTLLTVTGYFMSPSSSVVA